MDDKRDLWPSPGEVFEEFVQRSRRKGEERGVFGEERRAIIELMRGMFRFRPEEHLTIDQVLKIGVDG